ncbi:MAG TPA: thiamine phosphate synthase [Planctomycetota bacterium]|jgi:thiamine-phosphate pyrophosphorylase|nr:thiamine phosphate synthase [Planctomycetota bacterium]
MREPSLLLVTDGSGDVRRLEEVVRAARRGGLSAVQLREPRLRDRALFDLARRLRDLFPPGEGTLLVNDRVDVALASGADGVQLGFRSFAAASARLLLGRGGLVGVSVHSVEEARRTGGADFAIFGPVFATPSKEGILPPRGLEGLRRAVEESAVPIVAIGGLDPDRARACARAGAAGIACIRAIFSAADPGEAARSLRAAFEKGREGRRPSSRPDAPGGPEYA